MEWYYILDKQPENDSVIVQIDRPYDLYPNDFVKNYPMGMRHYEFTGSFDDNIKYLKSRGWPLPDYWWMYAKDFPFPKIDK